MQGRLVPPEGDRIQAFPRERWLDEFALGHLAGIAAIEWIFDQYGRDVNPLSSDVGIALVRDRIAQTGVRVDSLVADYFMDFPFVSANVREERERRQTLAWLLGQCRRLGMSRVVLPFVDASAMRSPRDEDVVSSVLTEALPVAESQQVEVHLETDLGPAAFARLLDRIDHPWLKVNYDSGNSASLGYRIRDEFDAYGTRIGSVHIKDRVYGGTTVPLGTGSVDFNSLFEGLDRLGYDGDLILQVARGAAGDEVQWARSNAAFVRAFVTGLATD